MVIIRILGFVLKQFGKDGFRPFYLPVRFESALEGAHKQVKGHIVVAQLCEVDGCVVVKDGAVHCSVIWSTRTVLGTLGLMD